MRISSRTVWLVVVGVIVGVMWACPCSGQETFIRRPTGRIIPSDSTPDITRLTASDPAINQFFGWTVAIDGDIAAVGAIQAEVDGMQYAGAVYIFKRTAGTWSQVQIITKPDPASSFYFGESIAVRGEDVPDTWDAGAVYVMPLPQPRAPIVRERGSSEDPAE